MKIIQIHYKISRPVILYKEIEEQAELMKRFIVHGDFKGFYNKAFAIAHCQVSETPMSFFVVDPECVWPKDKTKKMFESQVIINPEILEAPLHHKIPAQGKDQFVTILNSVEYQEACLSFPFRKPKRITRYNFIKVRYKIPGFFGLKIVVAELTGIASQIFQHEYDHMRGKNIYFESEQPVKWWELIGHDKSKGGTSLDDPADLGLTASKEKPNFGNLTAGIIQVDHIDDPRQ